MNAVAKIAEPSILVTIATKYGMAPNNFEATVRATCLPPDREGRQATREEFAAFLLVAHEYNLNPILKEIYGYRSKNGAIVPVVGVDGWIRIINAHPAFDGIEFDDHVDGKEVAAITARIWRKDRAKPTVVTEYLVECRRDPDKSPWGKWPRRMLRHKALTQCARVAFGFSGIVEPDEAERTDVSPMRDVTTGDGPPPPPAALSKDELEPGESYDAQTGEVIWGEPPQDDPLELPASLRRTPDNKIPPPPFDSAGWCRDAQGALADCTEASALFNIRKTIIVPAKGKAFPPDWQAVEVAYRQAFDRISEDDAA